MIFVHLYICAVRTFAVNPVGRALLVLRFVAGGEVVG